MQFNDLSSDISDFMHRHKKVVEVIKKITFSHIILRKIMQFNFFQICINLY